MSAATPTTGVAGSLRRREFGTREALLIIYVCALGLGSLNATIVNVTLPDIATDFGVGSGSIGSISIAYLVGYAVAIPASAWCGDRFGGRRVLLCSIGVFAACSTLCGLCQSLPELVLARALQGVAGGMTVPIGLTMLYREVPQPERVRLGALISIPPSVAQALGPVIGGAITTYLGWRWAFLINLPLGVAVVVFGCRFLRDDEFRSDAKLDIAGLLLASVGLSALLFGASQGAKDGWTSPLTLCFVGAGVLCSGALITCELHIRNPLLDLRLLGNVTFASSSATALAACVVFTSWLYLIAEFLQVSEGFSPLDAGIATLPQTLGVIVGSGLTSRVLYPRIGPRLTAMSGLALVAASVGIEGWLVQSGPTWALLLAFGVTGTATPLALQSSQTAGFASTSKADLSRATALYNCLRQIGGAVGIAIVATVLLLAVGAGRHDPIIRTASAYRDALLVLALIAVAAAAVASRMGDSGSDEGIGFDN